MKDTRRALKCDLWPVSRQLLSTEESAKRLQAHLPADVCIACISACAFCSTCSAFVSEHQWGYLKTCVVGSTPLEDFLQMRPCNTNDLTPKWCRASVMIHGCFYIREHPTRFILASQRHKVWLICSLIVPTVCQYPPGVYLFQNGLPLLGVSDSRQLHVSHLLHLLVHVDLLL